MDSLIKNEILTLDSREVAKMVEKNHKELLRDIRTYEGYLGESNFALTDFFIPSTYVNSQNKELPNYQITKKDLAERFQVSTTTIGRWVDDGIIPTLAKRQLSLRLRALH